VWWGWEEERRGGEGDAATVFWGCRRPAAAMAGWWWVPLKHGREEALRDRYDTIAEHVAARHTTAFRCGGKQWSLMLHCCMQGMVRGEDCKGVKRVGFIVEVILFLIVSIMEEGRKMKIHKNWW
jgi:hypothetical protein